MESANRYLNVSNKLGNAILLNRVLSSLNGANLSGLVLTDIQWIRIAIGVFGVICLILQQYTQKLIELNDPRLTNEFSKPIQLTEVDQPSFK